MKRYILRLLILSVGAFAMTGCNNNAELMSAQNNMQAQTMMAQSDMQTSSEPVQPASVNYKHVMLTNFNMDQQGNKIKVKPGTIVKATLNYSYHCPRCAQDTNSQIIIGLAKRSAQACIYNGGSQAQGAADFSLKVPAKPGKYDVRFRGVQAADCDEALKAGWHADHSPAKETTIGTIIVSRKADVVAENQIK
jgi:hypothetical protein